MTNSKKILTFFICALIAFALIFAGFAVNERSEIKKYKSIPLNLPENFTYTAHTGCMDTSENSLESINTGVQYGAQIVEFDLSFNEDNEPVLSHDAPKGDEATFDEALKKVAEYDNLKVNVDLKEFNNLEKVKSIAEKNGLIDRIFFTGVEEDDVEKVQSACSGIPYYLNVDVVSVRKQNDEYLLSLVQKVKESGAQGINMNKDNASKALVDSFHENGLLVSIWTVNKEKDIYKILSYAPDNITTKRPDKLREAIGVS